MSEELDIREYTKEHHRQALEHARKCALGTIETIYNNRKDCSGLSDVEIDKVRDSVQVLMYLKQLD